MVIKSIPLVCVLAVSLEAGVISLAEKQTPRNGSQSAINFWTQTCFSECVTFKPWGEICHGHWLTCKIRPSITWNVKKNNEIEMTYKQNLLCRLEKENLPTVDSSLRDTKWENKKILCLELRKIMKCGMNASYIYCCNSQPDLRA